jgi:hypothetical protein
MIPTFMIKPVFARLLIHVPVKSRDERGHSLIARSMPVQRMPAIGEPRYLATESFSKLSRQLHLYA